LDTAPTFPGFALSKVACRSNVACRAAPRVGFGHGAPPDTAHRQQELLDLVVASLVAASAGRDPVYREAAELQRPRFCGRRSPTGPAIRRQGAGDVVVWDSLAIAEYVAETHPDKRLWPVAAPARARARAVSAEMHSGFADLRGRMTMNCQLRLTNVLFDLKVQREVARIVAIWADCRQSFGAGGPFLFGQFTIADAFFAPMTQRFAGYGVSLPAVAQQYVDTIQALPAMKEWVTAARAETDFVARDEPYREDSSGLL
jgi:glutathione S-transferase